MSSLSKKISSIALSLGVLAGLSACGSGLPTSNDRLSSLSAADISNPLTIADSDSAFLDDVFSVLDAGASDTGKSTASADKASRWQNLKADHADLAAKFEALKNLSPDQRKAKMAEVGKDHPELFGGARPHFAAKGPGFAAGRRPAAPGFERANFKAPSAEQIKAFEALKDLKPEERKAKFDEVRKDHPDWFPAPPAAGAKPPMPRMAPWQGHTGRPASEAKPAS